MKINEIFCSLQGEGFHSGTAAVFVRFSGCNMQCPFCDTRHEVYTEMDEKQIVTAVTRWHATWVVMTGGEPALQLTKSLVDALHACGRRVAVETNGTLPLPPAVDWITCSPKDIWLGPSATPVLPRADELKVLFDGVHPVPLYDSIEVQHRFVQPVDTGDPNRNACIVAAAVEYVKQNPIWQLSLQIHKILGIR